jgi:hypothetical protein
LGIGNKPLGDMRAILEEELGIAVLVENFYNTRLEAASVLGTGYQGVALLSAASVHRQQNPLLARVYLAHELCHLLCDPVAPGQVLIAVDDSSEKNQTSAMQQSVRLLESRARGFAAELLLPREGIVDLLGRGPSHESSISEAEQMVARVAAHFRTTWQLTANHLENHRFLDRDIREKIKAPQGFGTALYDHTSLPQPGVLPGAIRHRLESRPSHGLEPDQTIWPRAGVLNPRSTLSLWDEIWNFTDLSSGAQNYLQWHGLVVLDEEDDAARLLQSHVLAQLAIKDAVPEQKALIPLPASRETLELSATLGRWLAVPPGKNRLGVALPNVELLRQISRQDCIPWNELQGPSMSLRFRFVSLAVTWTQETGALSSWNQISKHEAYQEILSLGQGVVPEILRWLQQGRPGHWGHALTQFAEAPPKRARDATSVTEARNAWIQWGIQHGYIKHP